MNEKFTPGNWKAEECRNGAYVIGAYVNDKMVDVVVQSTDEEGRYGSITCKADADVMAAAPELYAALQGMLAIEDSVTQGQERELREKWVPMARAALKKARGE